METISPLISISFVFDTCKDKNILLPEAKVTDTGVMFLWEKEEIAIELGVFEDGTVLYNNIFDEEILSLSSTPVFLYLMIEVIEYKLMSITN